MAANNIYIQVDFQSQNANAAITELNKNIAGIGGAATQATTTASRGMNTLSVSISQVNNELSNLAQGLAGLGLTKMGSSAIKAADDLNRMQFALRDLKGEMASTNLLYQQLLTVWGKVPFSQESILAAGLAMKNYGFNVNEVARNVQNLATVMAAHGLQEDALKPMIDTLNKMKELGTVRLTTLTQQFGPLGVHINEIINKSMPEVKEMLKKQEVNGAAFVESFLRGINQQAEKTDISPLMDRFTVRWEKFIGRVKLDSEKLINDIRPLLEHALNTADRLLTIFEGMPDPLRKAAEYMAAIAASVVTISGALSVGGMIAGGVRGTVMGAVGLAGRAAAATGVGAGVGRVVTGVGSGLLEGAGLVAGGSGALGLGYMAGLVAAIIGAITAAILAIIPGLKAIIVATLTAKTGEWYKTFKAEVDQTYLAQLSDWMFGPPGKAAGVAKAVVPELSKTKPPPVEQPPYALTKTELKAAQEDLANAQEKNLQGVAAIYRKYQEIYAQLKAEGVTSSAVIHERQLAEAQRVQNEIRTMQDETAKMTLENDKAKSDELAKYQERIAHEAAVDAEAVAQDTLEKQMGAAINAASIHARLLQDASDTRKAQAKEEYDHAEALMQRQMAADLEAVKTNKAQTEEVKKDYAAREAILKDTQRRQETRADQLVLEQTLADRERLFKESASRTTEYLKQADESERQLAITNIQHAAALAKDAVKTGEDQNAKARVDSIMKVAQIEIQLQQDVSAQKAQHIEDDKRDAIEAANELQAFYKDSKIPGLAEAAAAHSQEMRDAANRKFKDDQIALATDTEFAIQDIRMKAWRDANEKIIEEQKQVYEKLQSAAGTIWDALFQKGKSVGQAIGDAMKKAFMDMAKNFVTSNVSASMMELFTGEKVTMESRGSFGSGPLGKLAGMFTQHPVFHSKLEEPGHLSDAIIAPDRSIRATIVNLPPAGGRVEIESTSRSSNSINISGGGGGRSAPAAAMLAALLLGVPAPGAAASREVVTSQLLPAGESGTAYGGGAFSGGIGGAFGVLQRFAPFAAPGAVAAAGGGGGSFSMEPSAYGLPYSGGAGGVPSVASAQGGGILKSMAAALGKAGSSSDTKKMLQWLGIGGPETAAGQGVAANASVTAANFLKGGLALGLGMGLVGTGLSSHVHGAAATGDLIGGGALIGAHYGDKLGLTPIGGAALGAGVGLFAAGVKRGGTVGTLMDIGGGAAAGAVLGLRYGGPIGAAVGAVVGAAVGFGTGILRQTGVIQTIGEKVRARVKQFYGIDITNQGIIDQIADIAKQKFGGNVTLAVTSPEVMQLVQLYAVSVGQNPGGIPRPMYSATLAQSQAGGLQLQPVYNNGQMVASPYSGVTTQQYAQAADYLQRGIHLQLDPQMANDLFEGRVVSVMGNNPQAVASANTAAISQGDSRNAQAGGLLEPLTVLT